MRRQTELFQEFPPSNKLDLTDKLNLLSLYDRYAPVLLGIITKIVTDKAEAAELLEQTFVKVKEDLNSVKARKQPLFVWLLSIARCKALDALKARKSVPAPLLTLTTSGQVLQSASSLTTVPTYSSETGTDPRLKELIDSVLFKNCTPEEAALSIGIPVETVRQHLRLAMQQIRSSNRAKLN